MDKLDLDYAEIQALAEWAVFSSPAWKAMQDGNAEYDSWGFASPDIGESNG